MNVLLDEHKRPSRVRLRIEITGRVQGVGFRPFVCRLAREHALAGWVQNDPAGVSLEVEGDAESLDSFFRELKLGTLASVIVDCGRQTIPPIDETRFRILESNCAGEAGVFVPPDLAICAECLRELHEPANRRHQYPFINCAHCGPRSSIIESLPYDRPRTSMARFEMCVACRAEYESPDDRRFHAEPIACPSCGPALEWRAKGIEIEGDPLNRAVAALRAGEVIAIKGISGFHLMADAGSDEAARRLRDIKRRESKPFALMYPGMERLAMDAHVNEAERAILTSPESPIVLLEKKGSANLAASLATDNPLIGAMIASSPLHHILLERFGGPVVATSANFGEEPIIISNAEAEIAFGGMVDGILAHDREILRSADDSIVRIIDGRPCPLRIGRGMAPVPIEIPKWFQGANGACVLALGGHEKSSIALVQSGAIYLSRHLGDLDTPASREAYREAIDDFLKLHHCRPDLVVCDLHPDYFSTRVGEELAREFGCKLLRVQHHAAHLYSAMLEQEQQPKRCAALCWDGTGLGNDGTVWGAEWLVSDPVSEAGFRRVATIAFFPLPGGEVCGREPWRIALALAHESAVRSDQLTFAPDRLDFLPDPSTRAQVAELVARNHMPIHASSMGRLFDGVASILGLRHRAQYPAQPAMELEFLAMQGTPHRVYDLPIMGAKDHLVLDWRPMIREIIDDLHRGIERRRIAAAFHESLALACARLARRLEIETVLLTGGCFQNKLLAEGVARRLRESGLRARLHSIVPPNDGGLAAGQALLGLLHPARMQ